MLSDRDKQFINTSLQEITDRYLKSGKITIYAVIQTSRLYSSIPGDGDMCICRRDESQQYVLPFDEDRVRRVWREEINACIEERPGLLHAYGNPLKDSGALEELFEIEHEFLDAEVSYFTESTQIIHFALTEHGAQEYIDRRKDELLDPKIQEVPCDEVSIELHAILDCLVQSRIHI